MGIYLMTRMGITEVAQKADEFLLKNQIKFSNLFNTLGVDEYTYIFEYIGPDNKIVLDYEKEELVLTAIRHNFNGTYIFHDELQRLAIPLGIPVVGKAIDSEFEGKLSINDLNESVKLASGAEGVVVRFDTGEMVKIKAEEYCRKHASKELASSFKGLVNVIVNNSLDDILPQLEEPHLSKVKEYNEKIELWVDSTSAYVKDIVYKNKFEDQKAFALFVQCNAPKVLQPILFNVRKGDTPTDAILNTVKKNVSTNSKLTEWATAANFPIWTYSFFGGRVTWVLNTLI
jgi:T4 RnlA family RNA ligase